MPTFRVLCQDSRSGRQYPLVFEASSEGAARQQCEAHGHEVLVVMDESPLAPHLPQRLTDRELLEQIARSRVVQKPIITIMIGVVLGLIVFTIGVMLLTSLMGGSFNLGPRR